MFCARHTTKNPPRRRGGWEAKGEAAFCSQKQQKILLIWAMLVSTRQAQLRRIFKNGHFACI
jgi:hypothetical protein